MRFIDTFGPSGPLRVVDPLSEVAPTPQPPPTCAACDGPPDPDWHCDTCGAHLTFGEHPFCPHGFATGSVQPDSFNGSGMWVENLDANGPVWVTGRADLKRQAAARGLRWVPEGITGAKPNKVEDDMRGRFNGGASPTFRELHRPAPEQRPEAPRKRWV